MFIPYANMTLTVCRVWKEPLGSGVHYEQLLHEDLKAWPAASYDKKETVATHWHFMDLQI